MAKLGNITGTVSVGLDGHDTHSIATFEIPVTTTVDTQAGIAYIEAASGDAIRLAAAEALMDAASRLLNSLPTADVEDLHATPRDDAHTVTCATCGEQMTWNGPATLEHADNGAHVFSPRFN